MWEVVVRAVPAARLVALLPELDQVLLQLTDRAQVQDIVTWCVFIEGRVVGVREEPIIANQYRFDLNTVLSGCSIYVLSLCQVVGVREEPFCCENKIGRVQLRTLPTFIGLIQWKVTGH